MGKQLFASFGFDNYLFPVTGETGFSAMGSSRNPQAGARVFERATWLAASPEEVFAFHENPRNLEKISPAWLRVARIEADPVARAGGRFRIVARAGGLPVDWTGEWLAVEPPRMLRDGAVRAPFVLFEHEHRFEAEGAGTRMTDRVTYTLGGGGWGRAGRAVDAVIGWLVLRPMFRLRHEATRRFFSA